MTHRIDGARDRDIAARWCVLAEQRLQYLTELFETGRWRRYHSDHSFLENIQEAKTAVEIWRGLAGPEASPDNSAAEVSWLAPSPPRRDASGDAVHQFSPQPTDTPVYSPQFEVAMAAETDHVYSDEAPSAPTFDEPALNDISELALNLDAIEERYPLLRNAM
jgi:uncharacterized repeat protein (TIGR03809 family)